MAAHYDDPAYSYQKYWLGRDYEHQSEVLAFHTLLDSHKYRHAVDIGGGFGRLSQVLFDFASHVTLIEPSNKLRSQASRYLSDHAKRLTILPGIAQHITLPDHSQDLAIMVRVIHHLPQPEPSIKEIYRVLKPHGTFVLEYANSLNFKSRLLSILNGQPILFTPIERRSPGNIRRRTIPFVNHHPQTIEKLLSKNGFVIDQVLSVSNFRSPFLKQLLPLSWIIYLEKKTQKLLSALYFGPSIFVLCHKVK